MEAEPEQDKAAAEEVKIDDIAVETNPQDSKVEPEEAKAADASAKLAPVV